jgi:hypothetical protein
VDVNRLIEHVTHDSELSEQTRAGQASYIRLSPNAPSVRFIIAMWRRCTRR